MKIAFVPGEANSTIYFYEEREGWEWSAEVAVGVHESVSKERFIESARKELRGFLERALSTLADA